MIKLIFTLARALSLPWTDVDFTTIKIRRSSPLFSVTPPNLLYQTTSKYQKKMKMLVDYIWLWINLVNDCNIILWTDFLRNGQNCLGLYYFFFIYHVQLRMQYLRISLMLSPSLITLCPALGQGSSSSLFFPSQLFPSDAKVVDNCTGYSIFNCRLNTTI